MDRDAARKKEGEKKKQRKKGSLSINGEQKQRKQE